MFDNGLDGYLDALKTKSTASFKDDVLPKDLKYKSDSQKTLVWLRTLTDYITGKFDVEKALKKIDVKVHYENMEDSSEFSGYIEKRTDGWHIGINKYEVSGRQRFTLAHELAHLLFHRTLIEKKAEEGERFTEAIKLFREKENYRHEEMEANAFAAELLMPSHEFRTKWDANKTVKQISTHFDVSLYAVEFRAKKLSLPEKEA